MASYLIYIPGIQGAKNEHLDELGLQSLRADKNPEWLEVLQHGPDGGQGMIAIWREHDETDPVFGMRDSQDWTESPPDIELGLKPGAYWIGIDQECPVLPADIERPNRHFSAQVKLCDDNWWAIPVAARLPHRHGINHKTGEKYRRVAPRFEDFWNMSEQYAVQILQEMDAAELIRERRPDISEEELTVQIPLEDVWDYCVFALGLNYRINDAIIDRLGLLDDTTMVQVTFATMDMAEILKTQDEQKKTGEVIVFATVGSNMTCGAEG